MEEGGGSQILQIQIHCTKKVQIQSKSIGFGKRIYIGRNDYWYIGLADMGYIGPYRYANPGYN